ncbi:hypothetical protein [Catellatospora methionotrophica]|uniref:hypothetical protein n=1 Tax=Catellatospora methionotrophica TaxID=121620 RepID=UPI0033CC8057
MGSRVRPHRYPPAADGVETAAGVPPRSVQLFAGARNVGDLYDLPTLRGLEAAHRWLSVLAVTPEERGGDDVLGAALRTFRLPEREVYVCGPPALVGQARGALAAAGVPAAQIHLEDYDGGIYLPSPAPAASTAAAR